jgi:ABC-type Zn uptake system ZnuABC Zn-binding protein ZnuA
MNIALVGHGTVRFLIAMALALTAAGCARPSMPGKAGATPSGPAARVLATEDFLADFTRQIVGDRMQVTSLVPTGIDPRGYEPTPRDAADAAGARLIVANGAGLESFVGTLVAAAGGDRPVLEASHGLVSRSVAEGAIDPYFWLDPAMAVRYVQNIRDALSRVDPAGEKTYGANADAYIHELRELDAWIADQVSAVPEENRALVTNTESLGYFADRYGFRIVGIMIPPVDAEESPTAKQVAGMAESLKATGAPAAFLEMEGGSRLARQASLESGVPVVTGLYTRTLTDSSGPAPTYLEMMRHDVTTIVRALGGGSS